MNSNRIALLTLASTLLLPGLVGASSPQDNDNLDACCLAAEYRLPATDSGVASQPTQVQAGGKTPCQVPLGDLACCVGAEWKLDAR